MTLFFQENPETHELPRFELGTPEAVYSCPIFTVAKRSATASDGTSQQDMYLLRCAPWVNVVPVTEQGEIILVEQHRFGSDTVTLETPGGAVDKGEKDTTLAALRELEEETGHTSARLLALSGFLPNPAIQNNRVQYFLAFDCQPMGKASSHFDPYERIRVRKFPFQEAVQMVRQGRIQHALAALAVLLAEPYLSAKFKE
jgi:ADP-ribose pyrophosphatase